LDKYLQDIGKEELITAEIEVELAKRIKQGDQWALEKIGLKLIFVSLFLLQSNTRIKVLLCRI